MFLMDLLLYIFLIFIFGGFLSLGFKVWELLDDRYVGGKIGEFLSKQEYIFLRIFPPVSNEKSIGEMENFFLELLSSAKVVKPGPLYLFGLWHDEFIFEFHSNEGRVGVFVRLNRASLPLFESALSSSFPNASFEEVENPMTDWPETWSSDHYYDNMYGTEIITKASEIYPLKSWRDYQSVNNPNAMLQDPVRQLFNVLETVPKDAYACVQFMLRPHVVPAGVKKKWEKELQELRQEFSTNSAVEIGEDGTTSALTENEKTALNRIQRKINSPAFQVKTRFISFGKNFKAKDIFGTMRSFFIQFALPPQMLDKNGPTDTDPQDPGEDFGYIGPWVGVFKQKIHLNRESSVRQKEFYKAFYNRSFGRGGDPFTLDLESIASLIHFPVITEGGEDVSERISSDYGSGDNVKIKTTPPMNLPG